MEDPSAASKLAVETFFEGVSLMVGLIGLSGDTWRRPSGSVKTMNEYHLTFHIPSYIIYGLIVVITPQGTFCAGILLIV